MSLLNESPRPEPLPRSPNTLIGKFGNITRIFYRAYQETCQEAVSTLIADLLSDFREWCLLEMSVYYFSYIWFKGMVKIIDFLKDPYCEGTPPRRHQVVNSKTLVIENLNYNWAHTCLCRMWPERESDPGVRRV